MLDGIAELGVAPHEPLRPVRDPIVPATGHRSSTCR